MTVVLLAGLVVARLKEGDFGRRQPCAVSRFYWLRTGYLIQRPYFLPALAYLVIISIATLLSLQPAQSLFGAETRQGALFTASLVLTMLVVAKTVRSIQQAEWLVTGILIGSIPVALYGCIQYFGLDPLHWKTGSLSPVHSTTGYSLYLGSYLAMVVPFTLARFFVGSVSDWYKRNYVYLIILALQVACLVFTLSRGALVSLLVGCGVFFAFTIPHRQRWVFIGAIGALIVFGGSLLLALNFGWNIAPLGSQPKILRSDIAATRQHSNTDRLTVWMRTVPMISEKPLIGYGPDSYAATYAQYYPDLGQELETKTTTWDAHNLVLSQLMSVGILGLLAFGWILFIFYRKVSVFRGNVLGKPERLLAAALLGCVTAYLVQAQFNPSGMVATVIFWLVLGIGFGIASQFGLEE